MSTNETPAKAATPRNPFHAEMIVHVREIDGSVYLSSGNVCGLYTAFDIFCTEDEARYIAHAVNHAAQLETELAQAKRELAECRKDSARLDWLETRFEGKRISWHQRGFTPAASGCDEVLSHPTVRAAIDAAMKGADK